MPHQALSTQEIHTLFIEEISDAGGVGSDTFDDGNCLFARSILPWVADVRPRDEMKGGVALRAAEGEIAIHPYLFRTVCRNGAILAHAIQTRQVENYDFRLRKEVTQELREAVRTCCQEEVFTGAAQEVRLTVHREVDRALALMSFLSRLPSGAASRNCSANCLAILRGSRALTVRVGERRHVARARHPRSGTALAVGRVWRRPADSPHALAVV